MTEEKRPHEATNKQNRTKVTPITDPTKLKGNKTDAEIKELLVLFSFGSKQEQWAAARELANIVEEQILGRPPITDDDVSRAERFLDYVSTFSIDGIKSMELFIDMELEKISKGKKGGIRHD